MKQLSVEERAIRYDEALNRCREFYETLGNAKLKKEVEEIFPELKESKDERIMGNIIATIHLYYGEPLEDEAKEMIAWLKKQSQTFTKKDVDDAYLKGVCDAKHELEKQGKNNMGISEATKQKLEDNFNKALEKETPESWNKFLDEQKSADTEKGAKGNEVEIPISVWSEKDEGMLQTVINRLELSKNRNASEIPYVERCVDWLKSLRPQIHWKPSDEQMAVLNEVINYAANSEFQHWNNFIYTLLKSLREQLKKLSDE